MKKFAAVLAAALVALSVSLTVSAEPEDEGSQQSVESVASAEENEGSEDADQTEESDGDAQESSAAQENSAQPSQTPADTAKESDPPSASSAKLTEYRVKEAGMNIGIPSDMYVITRDTDKDDPVLAVNRTTKEEVTKRFEENDIYLRANTRDFACVVNVTVSETADTKTIGDLSDLSEENLQNIVNKLLESDIYKSCSKQTYNGVLFLAFSIGYDNNGTKTQGVQEYTIVDGKNIKITYQSSAEGNDPNKPLFSRIMKTVSFERAAVSEVSAAEKSLNFSQIDIRYIYLTVAAVLALIVLIVMIAAGVSYRKSKKTPPKKPKKKRSPPSQDSAVKKKDDSPKDIFSDTEKEKKRDKNTVSGYREPKRGTVTLKKESGTDDAGEKEELPEIKAKPMTYEVVMEEFSSSKADRNNDTKAVSDTEQENDAQDFFDDEIVYVDGSEKLFDSTSQEKTMTEDKAEQAETELSPYEQRFGKNRKAPAATEDKTAAENASSLYEKQFGKGNTAQNSDDKTSAEQHTADGEEQTEVKAVSESPFFAKFLEKLKNTNEEIAPEIDEMERRESRLLNRGDVPSDEEESKKKEKSKSNIELEISKAADGALIIGATSEADGKPVDIEIRDASHYREEEDRKLAEMGFETARQNEIYNARTKEMEENPFIVKAKSDVEKEKEQQETPETNADEPSESAEPSEIKAEESQDKTEEGQSKTEETAAEADGNQDAARPEIKKSSKRKRRSKNRRRTAAQNEPKEETEMLKPISEFERETGIAFERPLERQSPIVPMNTSFTQIPRLESVNAEEYNRQYEEMMRSMPKNHAYAQRFSTQEVSQPAAQETEPETDEPTFAETDVTAPTEQTAPAPLEEPDEMPMQPEEEVPAKTPEEEPQQTSSFSFYQGYEEEDPFSELPKGEEVIIKDHKKKSGIPFAERLKRSLGKLFASDDVYEDEEEEE